MSGAALGLMLPVAILGACSCAFAIVGDRKNAGAFAALAAAMLAAVALSMVAPA